MAAAKSVFSYRILREQKRPTLRSAFYVWVTTDAPKGEKSFLHRLAYIHWLFCPRVALNKMVFYF